jgi:hypothetical protein
VQQLWAGADSKATNNWIQAQDHYAVHNYRIRNCQDGCFGLWFAIRMHSSQTVQDRIDYSCIAANNATEGILQLQVQMFQPDQACCTRLGS